MIKGAQRRMVEIRTPESALYETAFFILRIQPPPDRESFDMIAEADRIIARSTDRCASLTEPSAKKRRKWCLHTLLPMLLGALIGGSCVGLVWLICRL